MEPARAVTLYDVYAAASITVVFGGFAVCCWLYRKVKP